MLKYGCVPDDFGLTYTVPLLKGRNCSLSKSLTVDDFRGIAISPVISKVFERCILQRYEYFLTTSDNQFGFKRGLGCSHAVYTLRSVVNHYTAHGSTVSFCALDLRKAFDKLNHHGLYLKLMHRMIPNNLLSILENWFDACATCVRWGNTFSEFFSVVCGVRQGGVLSPYLFAIFVDDIVSKVNCSDIGCRLGFLRVSVILYADDILLLAPSVTSLQTLLHIVEAELVNIDMALNAKKSFCMRFGPRFNNLCNNLRTLNGEDILWVQSCRYLGVWLKSARKFKCDFSSSKRSFYRAVNAIFSKVLRAASEETVLYLISMKCIPLLLYGLDSSPVTKTDLRSFDFAQCRLLMKLFKTRSVDIVNECRVMFGLQLVSEMVVERKKRFLRNFRYVVSNRICKVIGQVAVDELVSPSSR
jgi:hypothetical protein